MIDYTKSDMPTRPPQGASVETRQTRRRAAMKAAKQIAADDPKNVGLRRRGWREVFR